MIKGSSGECDSEPIYLHFDFDSYEAHFMGSITKNYKFIYERMVPPGNTTFFFTCNKLQTHSQTYPYFDEVNSIIWVFHLFHQFIKYLKNL